MDFHNLQYAKLDPPMIQSKPIAVYLLDNIKIRVSELTKRLQEMFKNQ